MKLISIIFLPFLAGIVLQEPIIHQEDIDNNSHQTAMRLLTEEEIQRQADYFYRHMISISIGNPPQELKVKLSSSFCGLWIQNAYNFKKGFNSTESSSFISSTESGEMEHVSGTIVKDTIIFISTKVEGFPFLLINAKKLREFNDHQGVIGFGYHCDMNNKATTDVLALLNNNSPDNQSLFRFRLNLENGKGRFGIGNMPKGFTPDPKYYRTAPIDIHNRSGQWKITLDSIYFDDGDFMPIKDKISFGLGGSLVSVTYDVFYQISNKYFSKLIENKECNININQIYEIVCNTDIVPPQMGVFSVIVGKWNFKVNASKLLINIPRNRKRVLWFAVVHYPEHNEFYISQRFLAGVHVIYNKGKGELGFFNSTE